MADRNISFLILAKDRASQTFQKVGGSADKAGGKLRALGKVGKVAGLGLAAGLGAVAVGAGNLAKNAAADAANARRLAVALKNTTGATRAQIAANEDWISAQGRNLGVTDDELRPALNKLVTATHDVGKAQKLASLGMDISAGTGKSLEVVSMALAKAQNGNVAALGRLGLKVKDADGKTKSLKDVTADLAKTFGGQASAAANSAEGKYGRLKLMMDETGEAIGMKLLPVLTTVADWMLNKGVPAIEKFAGWLGDKLSPSVGKAGGFFTSKLLPAFRQVVTWVQGKLIPAVKELAGKYFDGLRKAAANIQPHLKKLGPTIDLLKAAFKGVWNVISKVFLPILGKVYQTAFPLLGSAIGVVIDVIGKLSKAAIWLWNKAFQPSLKLIVGGIASVIKVFGKMLGALAKVPGFGWVKGAAEDLKEAGRKASELADGIKKIPTKKDVKVDLKKGGGWSSSWFGNILNNANIPNPNKNKGGKPKNPRPVTTDATGTNGRALARGSAAVDKETEKVGKSTDKLTGKLKKVTVQLSSHGAAMIGALVKGIRKGQVKLDKALDVMRAHLERGREKVADLQAQRADYLATFSGQSIFSADLGENGTGGFASVLKAAQDKAQKAAQLQQNVQRAVQLGLSKSLVQQLRDAGESGAEQLAAIVQGGAAGIAQLNQLDKAATSALQSAGLTAGNAANGRNIDAQINAWSRDAAVAQSVVKALQGFSMETTVKLSGDELVMLIKARNRKRGVKTAGV